MKFNFDPKLYFSYFFDPWFERGERMWLDSDGREKKSRLRSISTMKKNDFSVNKFLLMEKVYSKCCFPLNLSEMIDLSLKVFFCFGLIVSFEINFWVVKRYEYILQGV
jgi:hypothetical protein